MNKANRSKSGLILKWGTLVSRIKGLVSLERTPKQVAEIQPESDVLLRYLVGCSSDMFYLIDAEGSFVDISQGACDSLGFTREELLGLSLRDILAESDQKKTARILEQASSEDPVTWQVTQRRKDGSLFPAEIRVGASDSWDGKILIAVGRDLTDLGKSESSVQENIQLLETILDHTHMLIAYMDPRFNFVRVNRAYAEADKRDPSFFPGKNHFDLYPNEENERIFQRVVETGEPFFANAKPFEYAEHPERGVTYWDWSLVPINDSEAAVKGVVLTLVNVTEKKLAEQALVDSEVRLRKIFNSSNDAIFLLNPEEGNILDANPTACRMLGYSREELLSLGISALHPDGLSSLNKFSNSVDEHRRGWTEEFSCRTKEGVIFQTEVSASMADFGGKLNIIAIMRDVTERRQSEKQIELEIARTETLMRIAARLNAPLSLDAVLEAVCEETSRGLNGLPVMILLLDEEANLLEPVAAFGLPIEFHHDYRPVSARVFGDYRTTKDTLVVLPDIQVEAGSHSAAFYRHYGIRSAVKAFLIREKVLIGMLNVYSFEAGRRFSEEELLLIRGIADQAAQAIENARLREKSKRVAVIEERSRLARDLHDSVAQALYGVTLNAQAGERMYAAGDIDQAADQLRKISKSSQEALRDMRLLIYELRPADLEEEGLSAALQARLDRVEKRSGLETSFKVELKSRLSRDLEEGLYRIAQEALNNVLKHAQAKRVDVLLGEERGKVFVEVVDDGVGLDAEDLEAEGGLGISGMQERAARIGGKLSIDSHPGQGTCVKVEVDLRQDVRG